MALLIAKKPLPDQDPSIKLQGAGAGFRGSLTKHVEYEFDWAMPLSKTDQTKKYDNRFYFNLKALF
jgi:hemolysin activation/secretion protein